MTPEEIVFDIEVQNRQAMAALGINSDQMLQRLNEASMRGFKMGSDMALAMVKGTLLVQLERTRT